MENLPKSGLDAFRWIKILKNLALVIQSMDSAFYSLGHIQGIVILGKVAGRLQALCWESYALLSHLEKIDNS